MSSRIVPLDRRGFTLLELMVVIAILTLMMGLSGVAMLRPRVRDAVTVRAQLRELRLTAVRTRVSRTTAVQRGDSLYSVTAFPDGSIAAEPSLHVNPATGLVDDAPR